MVPANTVMRTAPRANKIFPIDIVIALADNAQTGNVFATVLPCDDLGASVNVMGKPTAACTRAQVARGQISSGYGLGTGG